MSKRKSYSREYKIGAIQMIEQKGMTTREAMESDPVCHAGAIVMTMPLQNPSLPS